MDRRIHRWNNGWCISSLWFDYVLGMDILRRCIIRILAIDPGKRVGIVTWEPETQKIFHTIYNQEEALSFFRDIEHGSANELFNYVGIEMIGHYGSGMPAGKDVFDTCIFIGEVKNILRSFYPMLILRREIKLHFCGNMRAKDGNIRQALIDRFGGKEKAIGRKTSPGPLYGIKGDEWQALALSVFIGDTIASKPIRVKE